MEEVLTNNTKTPFYNRTLDNYNQFKALISLELPSLIANKTMLILIKIEINNLILSALIKI